MRGPMAAGGDMPGASGARGDQWAEVREAWNAYRGAVGAWLDAARDPDAEPGLVEVLADMVAGLHGEWTAKLQQLIDRPAGSPGSPPSGRPRRS